ncbi:AraC family transcriptional regulator [Paenibacillus alginolyticus]|uniref:AraC family transcriptional regulator n=1 Tax=Paenibacillus alginolyticus TaxID=59839 RepID=A0ABT4GEN5_9BACL|nr:AraC family transcriptional regulator [Paenibacillus alginolyticus]MCY9666608.1 AraC family transcriptional regulator [Paenibacillus alginolyticus]MCY9694569.1 AraC family transcriptional regulator [Paenibacillus alginolyticus]MEC0148136.1 AraC family transcriptional regulator [Paenibacillus alginolyticus]
MHPVRKVFDANDAFPFSYAYKNTKSSQSELPEHFHDWYEIVYVYRGKGTFFIDHTFYEMKQGDLFLIPGNTIHRATPDREMPVTSTAIYFNPSIVQVPNLGDSFSYLHCFDQAAEHRNYKLETLLPQRQHLDVCLESIQYECKHQSLGHRQAILLQLLQLLLFLNRDLDSGIKPNVGDSIAPPVWMREILLYIDQHFCEDIGLKTLSKQASVTPAHFSRVFKQLIGMNITAYIMTKRIIRAKQLLSENDLNINIIAEMCGFESLPHFHAMFKRVLGMTPAAARKSTR